MHVKRNEYVRSKNLFDVKINDVFKEIRLSNIRSLEVATLP